MTHHSLPLPKADEQLKKITVRNLSYNSIATLFVYALQFGTNIFLARVLTPEDYGIVGFAQIFTNFMMQFCDFGLNSAVIQRKEVDDATINTAFTLKALFSFAVFILIITIAPLSNLFMNQQVLSLIIRILSINFLTSIVIFLPQVLLTRELDYKKLVVPQTISAAVSSTLSIVLAYNGFGFWCIVIGSITSSVINATILYVIKPVPLKVVIDIEIAKQLIKYGASLLFPGVIIFIIFNCDNFLIGTLKGAAQLGYYAIAFNWGSMICVLIAGMVHKVLFPTFSKLQHNIPAMRQAYLASIRYIVFLVLPVNILLLVEGREFLIHVLGRGTDRWLPALLALQILSVYGIFRTILEPNANVIVGLGKPQLLLKAILLVALIEIGFLYPAVKFYGIEGVAVIVTIAYVSQYLIYLPIMKKEINIHAADIFNEIKVSAFAAIAMLVTIITLKQFYHLTLMSMIINSVIGVIVYVMLFGKLDKWKAYHEIHSLLKSA